MLTSLACIARPMAFTIAFLCIVEGNAAAKSIGFLDVGEPGCWTRDYSSSHMAKHPKQKVTSIVVSYAPSITYPDDGPQQQWHDEGAGAGLNATVSVTLKGKKERLVGVLSCEGGSADSLRCHSVGAYDPSALTLTMDEGQLRLANHKGFVVMQRLGKSDVDFDRQTTIDPRDDHDVFILSGEDDGAPGSRCKAMWPYPIGN